MPELIEKGKVVAYLKSRECEFSDECGKYWVAGFRAAREAIEKFPTITTTATTLTPRKTPHPTLKYPGSKWRMAEWIISLMPPHKSYLEPFFGSGAVFFKKPPSRIETINDLDGEIVNLFRCIREQPEALMRAVATTPYSRGEYEQAWRHFKEGGQIRPDGIEAARLTLVRYWQAHGSTVV